MKPPIIIALALGMLVSCSYTPKGKPRPGFLGKRQTAELVAIRDAVAELHANNVAEEQQTLADEQEKREAEREAEKRAAEAQEKEYLATNGVYKGELKNGKRHGRGVVSYPNGTSFQGAFANGVREGHGRFSYPGGPFVKGRWERGKIQKYAMWISPTNEKATLLTTGAKEVRSVKYSVATCRIRGDGEVVWLMTAGQCRGKLASGKCSAVSTRGHTYEGECKEGYFHGRGKRKRGEDYYKGAWKRGKFHGTGRLSLVNHDYQGTWKNGRMSGQGVLSYSGGKYVGSFRNDNFDGQGTLYYKDGRKYIGTWKDGRMHGPGKYFGSNGGYKFTGRYNNGERSGKGTEVSSDGSKYVGMWRGGKKFGRGTKYFGDGIICRANFPVKYTLNGGCVWSFKSPKYRTSSARYAHAGRLAAQGKKIDAIIVYSAIIDDTPNSRYAVLAAERLGELNGKKPREVPPPPPSPVERASAVQYEFKCVINAACFGRCPEETYWIVATGKSAAFSNAVGRYIDDHPGAKTGYNRPHGRCERDL